LRIGWDRIKRIAEIRRSGNGVMPSCFASTLISVWQRSAERILHHKEKQARVAVCVDQIDGARRITTSSMQRIVR